MLVELRITNFMSFKEEQIFSLLPASSLRDGSKNTIACQVVPDGQLLSTTVFYGANASGKSNLIAAILHIRIMLMQSTQPQTGADLFPFYPFKFDTRTSTKPSRFEIVFVQNSIRYEYGFVQDKQNIFEEWLFAYPAPNNRSQLWFQRPDAGAEDANNWYFNERKLKGEKKNLVSKFMNTNANRLFLAVAAPWNPQLATVFEWFDKHLLVLGLSDSSFRNQLRDITARKLLNYDSYRPFILNMLQRADLGIVDIHVDEDFESPTAQKTKGQNGAMKLHLGGKLKVKLVHQIGIDNKGGVSLDWHEESTGTQLLFSLAGVIEEAFRFNRILIIDELDTSLHPSLVRAIVDIFHKRAALGGQAQLIFSSHDTTLLNPDLFRRDQIWFIEKDHGGASHIYSLLEFKPRKGEALQKGYLEGRYGALPFVGEMLFDEQA